MGQIPYGSAKATHAIRGELQRSQASAASLVEIALSRAVNVPVACDQTQGAAQAQLPIIARLTRSHAATVSNDSTDVGLTSSAPHRNRSKASGTCD